jgi:hypothetical protein
MKNFRNTVRSVATATTKTQNSMFCKARRLSIPTGFEALVGPPR